MDNDGDPAGGNEPQSLGPDEERTSTLDDIFAQVDAGNLASSKDPNPRVVTMSEETRAMSTSSTSPCLVTDNPLVSSADEEVAESEAFLIPPRTFKTQASRVLATTLVITSPILTAILSCVSNDMTSLPHFYNKASTSTIVVMWTVIIVYTVAAVMHSVLIAHIWTVQFFTDVLAQNKILVIPAEELRIEFRGSNIDKACIVAAGFSAVYLAISGNATGSLTCFVQLGLIIRSSWPELLELKTPPLDPATLHTTVIVRESDLKSAVLEFLEHNEVLELAALCRRLRQLHDETGRISVADATLTWKQKCSFRNRDFWTIALRKAMNDCQNCSDGCRRLGPLCRRLCKKRDRHPSIDGSELCEQLEKDVTGPISVMINVIQQLANGQLILAFAFGVVWLTNKGQDIAHLDDQAS